MNIHYAASFWNADVCIASSQACKQNKILDQFQVQITEMAHIIMACDHIYLLLSILDLSLFTFLHLSCIFLYEWLNI